MIKIWYYKKSKNYLFLVLFWRFLTVKTRLGVVSRLVLPSGESDLVRAMVLLLCLNYRLVRKEKENGKGFDGADPRTRTPDPAWADSHVEDSGRVQDHGVRRARQVPATRGLCSAGDHLGRADPGADRGQG